MSSEHGVIAVRLTIAEFKALPEYSGTLPTISFPDSMWLKPSGRFPHKLFKRSKIERLSGYTPNPEDNQIMWFTVKYVGGQEKIFLNAAECEIIPEPVPAP